MKRRFATWARKVNSIAIETLPGVLFVGLIGAALWLLVTSLLDSPARSAREQILADSPPGASVELLRPLSLRSAAETSYLVVVARPDVKADRAPPRGRTGGPLLGQNELRIYDREGDSLSRSLTLRPEGLLPRQPTLTWEGVDWSNPQPRRFRFFLHSTDDLDRDGRAEVIGVFRDPVSGVSRPIAIVWNETDREYVVSPLIAERPSVPLYDSRGPIPSPAGWDRYESRLPLRVSMSPGERSVDLYGATAVKVARVPDAGPVLIAGFAVLTVSKSYDLSGIGKRRPSEGGLEFSLRTGFGRRPVVGRLAVDVAQLRDREGEVALQPCTVYGTSRIRPGLVVPRFLVSALPKSPLDPHRIHLSDHIYC
jgi:hypothetical protein